MEQKYSGLVSHLFVLIQFAAIGALPACNLKRKSC